MTTPSPEAVATATRVMLALTGRRWTWPRKQVVEEYWVPETISRLDLVGRPVVSIATVVDRQGNDFTFELSDRFRLRLPQLEHADVWPYYPWPAYDANAGVYPNGIRRSGIFLTVTYVYGSPPPSDVLRAINQIAVELDEAALGHVCRLPERVTSVTREGVSWTVLDPQQFLEGGKTGLYYPDLIISTYGNQVRARAKVYSPEHLPPRRLSVSIVEDAVNRSEAEAEDKITA